MQLANIFARTHTEEVNAATAEINALWKSRPDFLALALAVAETVSIPDRVRQSAAINAKNYVYEYWDPNEDDEEVVPIPEEVRAYVRANILQLACRSPNSMLRPQYEVILGIVSHADYPDKWPTFIREFVEQLDLEDAQITANTLKAMHIVFYHYQTRAQTNELMEELATLQGELLEPLYQVFIHWSNGISQAVSANDQAVLDVLFSIVQSFYEVMYDMSAKDIPAFVQDHIGDMISPGMAVTMLPPQTLKADEQENATSLEGAQSAFFELMRLYASNYEFAIEPLIEQLVSAAFENLTTRPDSPRFDRLVITGMNFLSCLARNALYVKFFSEDNIQALCKFVIVPQIQLRETDAETFEMNPEQYVNMDLFGSDLGTRRRCASDFIRALCKHFEKVVSDILRAFVDELMAGYASDPANNWRLKDAAIYIVLAMSIRGSESFDGEIEINEYVDVGTFYDSHIVPALTDANTHPIIRAGCMKFLIQFRSRMPEPLSIAELFMQALPSEYYVIRTYAAVGLDRYLSVCEPGTKTFRITDQQVAGIATEALTVLSNAVEGESAENEHIAKCMLRICYRYKAGLPDFAEPLFNFALAKLQEIPRTPGFAHNMFELMAAAISVTPQAKLDADSASIIELCMTLLTEEKCSDFQPYLIQILAQLVENSQSPTVVEFVTENIQSFLATEFWEGGRGAALTRFMTAVMAKNLIADPEVYTAPLLAAFKHMTVRPMLHEASFKLINALFLLNRPEVMAPHLVPLTQTLYIRLSKQPGPEYIDHVLLFWARIVLAYGPDVWLDALHKANPKGVIMSIKLWERTVKTMYSPKDKRLLLAASVPLAAHLVSMNDPGFTEVAMDLVRDCVYLAAVAHLVSTNIARFIEDEWTIREEEETRVQAALREDEEQRQRIESHQITYEPGFAPLRFAPEPQYPHLQCNITVQESLFQLRSVFGDNLPAILGDQLYAKFNEMLSA